MAYRPDFARPSTHLPSYRPGRAAPSAPGAPAYKLSSNENPYPPLPSCWTAVAAAAHRTAIRTCSPPACGAIAERLDVPGAIWPPGTGRGCPAAGRPGRRPPRATRSSTPGDRSRPTRSWCSLRRQVGPRAAGRRRPPRPRRDGGRRHRPDPAGAGLLPEQPHRTRPCARRDRAFLDQSRRCAGRPRRGLLRVRPRPRRSRRRSGSTATGQRRVLRTFSKAYGLAGLRVGFAVAHEPVADALRKTAVPFGVCGIAQQAAIESLRRRTPCSSGSDAGRRTGPRASGAARPGLGGASQRGQLRLVASRGRHHRIRCRVRQGRRRRPGLPGRVPGHRRRARSERPVPADRCRVAQIPVVTCGRHPGFGGRNPGAVPPARVNSRDTNPLPRRPVVAATTPRPARRTLPRGRRSPALERADAEFATPLLPPGGWGSGAHVTPSS